MVGRAGKAYAAEPPHRKEAMWIIEDPLVRTLVFNLLLSSSEQGYFVMLEMNAARCILSSCSLISCLLLF